MVEAQESKDKRLHWLPDCKVGAPRLRISSVVETLSNVAAAVAPPFLGCFESDHAKPSRFGMDILDMFSLT